MCVVCVHSHVPYFTNDRVQVTESPESQVKNRPLVEREGKPREEKELMKGHTACKQKSWN